jgi:hypothetical protein
MSANLDPTMPRQLPPSVERALRDKLGWRDRPNRVDLYNAIRDALEEAQAGGAGQAGSSSSAAR